MATLPKTPVPDTLRAVGSSPKDQATWLLNKLQDSIDYIRNMREKYQRRAGRIRIGTLILSGVVTALIGIRWEEYSVAFRNVAIILSALTTALTSLDFYFNYRSLWVEHEETEWRLHRLRDRIQFYLEGRPDGAIDAVTVGKFHESYQWIWDRLSTNWLSLRRNSQIKQ